MRRVWGEWPYDITRYSVHDITRYSVDFCIQPYNYIIACIVSLKMWMGDAEVYGISNCLSICRDITPTSTSETEEHCIVQSSVTAWPPQPCWSEDFEQVEDVWHPTGTPSLRAGHIPLTQLSGMLCSCVCLLGEEGQSWIVLGDSDWCAGVSHRQWEMTRSGNEREDGLHHIITHPTVGA